MNFPGKKSIWNGFERFDFEIEGISCIIVKPKKINDGNPWIWRARFFDAFPNLDIAMLNEGWLLAYIDVAELYGSPETMRRFDMFYNFLVKEYNFAARAVLEGFSRGGLTVFNWGCRNLEKVSCIYADNPVCDFKSWPGGMGNGPGDKESWERCLNAYGFTEEEAKAYDKNPLDNVGILTAAGMPLIIVYGDADEVVPVEENCLLMIEAYKKSDSKLKTICKKGNLHHPHCLEDPSPIVEFIKSAQ